MWPFKSKKQPILRILSEELLGYTREPSICGGGICVDTFAHYAITYENVETGEKHVQEAIRLA